jgi:hypothetical protein
MVRLPRLFRLWQHTKSTDTAISGASVGTAAMAGNTPQAHVANAAMNARARHRPAVGATTG